MKFLNKFIDDKKTFKLIFTFSHIGYFLFYLGFVLFYYFYDVPNVVKISFFEEVLTFVVFPFLSTYPVFLFTFSVSYLFLKSKLIKPVSKKGSIFFSCLLGFIMVFIAVLILNTTLSFMIGFSNFYTMQFIRRSIAFALGGALISSPVVLPLGVLLGLNLFYKKEEADNSL